MIGGADHGQTNRVARGFLLEELGNLFRDGFLGVVGGRDLMTDTGIGGRTLLQQINRHLITILMVIDHWPAACIVQQPREDFLRVGIQTDHDIAIPLDRPQICFGDQGSAARRNHDAIGIAQFVTQAGLHCAEERLAFLREDLRNGFAHALGDDLVSVDKIPAQLLRDHLADGALASAHKAGQDQVILGHQSRSLLDVYS